MPDDATTVCIASEADIATARRIGRNVAEDVGFSATDATLIATAISEIARNMLTYADGGEVRIAPLGEPSRAGVEVVAVDHGPGIADLPRAMEDGYSSGDGLGLGLPGARRLVDEFDIVAPVGVGTTVTMRKWRRR